MKKIFDNITESEKNRILELHSLKINLNEQQSVPLMTILSTPKLVGIQGNPQKDNTILLTMRNQEGNVISKPYQFEVSGEYDSGYSWIPNAPFSVSLRGVYRDKSGNLLGQAIPKNKAVKVAMDKFLPEVNKYGRRLKTKDGWFSFFIESQKVNDAINKLKNNQGSSAEMDAGSGVKIILKKI